MAPSSNKFRASFHSCQYRILVGYPHPIVCPQVLCQGLSHIAHSPSLQHRVPRCQGFFSETDARVQFHQVTKFGKLCPKKNPQIWNVKFQIGIFLLKTAGQVVSLPRNDAPPKWRCFGGPVVWLRLEKARWNTIQFWGIPWMFGPIWIPPVIIRVADSFGLWDLGS